MSEPTAPVMVKLTIDGKTVEVPKGMNLVEAAKLAGVEIPVFCYHPKLDPAGVCRMCLVEVEGQRKPVTACTFPVTADTVVKTKTPVVEGLRRGVLELLLLNHPLDCPICDKGGECDLQDLTYGYGPAVSRLQDPKVRGKKAWDLGRFIVFDEERCILCRRCVRFDDEVAQERTLVVEERAHEATITTPEGVPYNSYFSGNTIELCPVGALTSRLYRFKARPWDLARVPSICTGCSVGCATEQHYRHGQLVRVIGRENPQTGNGWLCDRGRFNYQYVQGASLLSRPLVRRDGRLVEASWEEALGEVASRLRAAIAERGPQSVGVIGGGRLSNEEAYLLQRLARAVLGTNNVDHRSGAQRVASLAAYPGRQTDVDGAAVILLADVQPAEVAPVLDLRIRRAVARRRATLVQVGPVVQAYQVPRVDVPVPAGETAAAIRQLATATTAALAGGEATVGQGAGALLWPANALERAAKALAGGGRVVVIWGGDDPAVGQAVLELLDALRAADQERGLHLLIPGEQANSRGAEAMGALPGYLPGFRPVGDAEACNQCSQLWGRPLPAEPGLDVAGMLAAAAEGRLAALYVVGANLALTFPNGALAAQALERVPFLVVQDLFLTETAAQADVVLPAAPFTARVGQYTTLDGLVQEVKEPASRPQGEAQLDGAIFGALAQALGAPWPRQAELEAELTALGLVPAAGQSLPGSPLERLAAESATPSRTRGGAQGQDSRTAGQAGRSLRLVAVPALMAGGGTAWFDEPFRKAAGFQPEVLLHPQDAAALGVGEGESVELVTAHGRAVMTVRVAPRVATGTAAIWRGWPEAPANRLCGSDPYPNVQVARVAARAAV